MDNNVSLLEEKIGQMFFKVLTIDLIIQSFVFISELVFITWCMFDTSYENLCLPSLDKSFVIRALLEHQSCSSSFRAVSFQSQNVI